MEEDTSSPKGNKKQLLTTLAVLLVVVLIAVGAVAFIKNNNDEVATDTSASSGTSNNNQTTESANTSTEEANQKYKDGTYAVTGTYNTPGGIARVAVKVTVDNGVITDSTVTNQANNPESSENQDHFISGYKTLVVGKDIDSIKLSRVSGSSLTPKGFNDAIEQIKAQAQA